MFLCQLNQALFVPSDFAIDVVKGFDVEVTLVDDGIVGRLLEKG